MKKIFYRRNFIKQSTLLAGYALISPLFITSCKKVGEIISNDPLSFTPPDDTGAASITAYPAPPGLLTSNNFTVWANGVPIWVEKYDVPLPTPPYAGGWNGGEESFVSRAYAYIGDVQKMAIARFASTGPVTITIDLESNAPSCVIRPKHDAIVATGVNTKRLTFQIQSNKKYYIEIGNLPPLVIFSDAPEVNVPSPGAPNLHYFGPGAHHVGKLTLNTNDTVYLAPGSIVYGRIFASNCWNVTIRGRGILEAENSELDAELNAIYTEWCNGVHVKDLLIRKKNRGWTCNMAVSRNVNFDNAKILTFGANNDGIDIAGSSTVSITNSFLRCTDDCVTIKSNPAPGELTDVVVQGCILYGVASSDGFTIGYELKGPVNNIRVIDCDIIGGMGESTAGGHCAFSIICDGPGPVTNVLFENIRIEDKVEYGNFDITVTNGQHYAHMPPGSISGVILRNIHWERGDVPIYIHGFDNTHKVSDVSFINCSVAGVPLINASSALIEINGFTENITFQHD